MIRFVALLPFVAACEPPPVVAGGSGEPSIEIPSSGWVA